MQTVRGGWLQGPTGTAMIPGSCADSSATILNVSEVILICESHHMLACHVLRGSLESGVQSTNY